MYSSKNVIDILVSLGVKAIALRCAGFNNVDIEHAFKKIHILLPPNFNSEEEYNNKTSTKFIK